MRLRNYPQNFLLLAFFNGLTSAFASKQHYRHQKKFGDYERYRQTAYHLRRKGLLTVKRNSDGQRFLELTKKGALEILLIKAGPRETKNWDGKWRVIFFDIPEETNNQRDRLRRLLLANGFIKMQESVYVSPYSLNREAIEYLKQTKLIKYIRIGRLEELDDDSDLLKSFRLSNR